MSLGLLMFPLLTLAIVVRVKALFIMPVSVSAMLKFMTAQELSAVLHCVFSIRLKKEALAAVATGRMNYRVDLTPSIMTKRSVLTHLIVWFSHV